MSITPQIGFNYLYLTEEGYKEKGSLSPLHIRTRHEDSLVISAGSQVNYQFGNQTNTIKELTAHAEMGYDFLSNQTEVAASFEGGGPVFKTQGTKPGAVIIKAGVGMNFMDMGPWDLSVNYDATSRAKFLSQQMSATLKYRW
jgi:outer membrane autotransporter protein